MLTNMTVYLKFFLYEQNQRYDYKISYPLNKR